jgi:hypothetical protein
VRPALLLVCGHSVLLWCIHTARDSASAHPGVHMWPRSTRASWSIEVEQGLSSHRALNQADINKVTWQVHVSDTVCIATYECPACVITQRVLFIAGSEACVCVLLVPACP